MVAYKDTAAKTYRSFIFSLNAIRHWVQEHSKLTLLLYKAGVCGRGPLCSATDGDFTGGALPAHAIVVLQAVNRTALTTFVRLLSTALPAFKASALPCTGGTGCNCRAVHAGQFEDNFDLEGLRARLSSLVAAKDRGGVSLNTPSQAKQSAEQACAGARWAVKTAIPPCL